MFEHYIEANFFNVGMMCGIQYLMMGLAIKESRNCLGKKRVNNLLWLLPKEMSYVTFLTKAILVGAEVFCTIGVVLLVIGEFPVSLFWGEMFFILFVVIYIFVKTIRINKKIKGEPRKSFMEGQKCGTKPLKVQMYGSGVKEFIYGIIIKASLVCVMNVVWLLRDPSPFIPFMNFLEWFVITGLAAYLSIRLWLEEKGFRRVITVEGGRAVYKDGRGKCRRFSINDLCWMDSPNGGIEVWYRKEELIEIYVILAHGVKEFCSVVEEVEWKEPED